MTETYTLTELANGITVVLTVRRIRRFPKPSVHEIQERKSSMIIIILIALVILLLIWGIATYNRLITERLKVQTQWSQIDVVLKQRFDLIPNLVETVKGYAAHENEALQAVADARSRYLSAADTEGQMKASTGSTTVCFILCLNIARNCL